MLYKGYLIFLDETPGTGKGAAGVGYPNGRPPPPMKDTPIARLCDQVLPMSSKEAIYITTPLSP